MNATRIPRFLLESIDQNRCILFLGAGVSLEAGLPGAAELSRTLAESASYPKGFPNDLLDISQYYEARLGRNALMEAIYNALEIRSKPSETQRLIAALSGKFKWIITTNYDALLERAFEDQQRNFYVVADVTDLPSAPTSGTVPIILKIHGDLRRGNIVLTRDDYNHFISSSLNSTLGAVLRAELATGTFLFVGYSLRDYNFVALFESVQKELGKHMSRGFGVMPSPDPVLSSVWSKRGIEVIDAVGNDFFNQISQSLAGFGPTQIFLSYSHEDEIWAEQIRTELAARGIKAFSALREIRAGDDIAQGISEALVRSQAYVILLSPESVQSRWILRELQAALSLRRGSVFPIVIRNCDIPASIQDIRFLDARRGLASVITDLVQRIEELHPGIQLENKRIQTGTEARNEEVATLPKVQLPLRPSGKLPTIIDNREENNVLNALRRLLPEVESLDIASGFFEVGSLLALDGFWQLLKQARILMGDEMTKRTRQELLAALVEKANDSVEQAKEQDDSLRGLPAIRQALHSKQIQAKIYARAKFHAKTYLMQTNERQLSNYGIVGSSNFTRPGLTQNLELNLLTTDELYLNALGNWFEEMWRDADDVSADVIKVLEPHLREYTPFEVYVKALYEYFAGKEKPITSWEENESIMWQVLSKYQRDGYRNAVRIADKWKGALICDGVGLGKTFIGLMLLEYHLHRNDNVLLIVPRSARESVWEANIEKYFGERYPVLLKKNLDIRNHTDFGREGTIRPEELRYYREYANAVIIDEAHHFRNPLRGRGRRLKEFAAGKPLYMLTATPINNSLDDLYHLINYFAQGKADYFSELGVNNLRARFLEAERKMEESLEEGADIQAIAQAEDFLRTDVILKAILIQRSRAYVKEAERLEPTPPVFPVRETPQVIKYSLKKVYAGIYDDIRKAFDRDEPLLNFKIYSPEQFRLGQRDERILQHEKQVVGLIRTLLLKRLESSWKAFEASLEDLLEKMMHFVERYAPERAFEWRDAHALQWATIQQHAVERNLANGEEEEDDYADDPDVLDPKEYDLEKLLPFILSDMTQLVSMLAQVYERFYEGETDPKKQLAVSARKDDKLQNLVERLHKNDRLAHDKVVIFTEFRDTARYLWKALTEVYGLTLVDELDSTRKVDRERTIKRFAPYYNCRPDELVAFVADPIRVLISTDVLSEGLNLQDSTQIMNYDLHWNPVRLMQRIGRVDRRLNLDVEKQLGRFGEKPLRVFIYNFLPPNELDGLLNLLKRITGKVLRISKTLGIEAPIGLPDEPESVLKNFNEKYEGGSTKSIQEEAQLELARIARAYPDLYARLEKLPRRLFSGKHRNPQRSRGIFCAYRFSPPDPAAVDANPGEMRWYFRDAADGKVVEGIESIYETLKCQNDTPRYTELTWDTRNDARKAIESHIRSTYLRAIQAPAGYKPTLICWMEIS